MAPRDFDSAERVGLVGLARLYSNVVSPPTMFAVMGFAICFLVLPFWEAVAWGTVYGVMLSLLPIIFVLYLLQNGYIKELHMSDTRERKWPYIVAVVCALLALGVQYFFDAPYLLRCMTIFNAIELAALAIITAYWLISMHSTAAMAVMVLIGLLWGWPSAFWIGIPLVVSVSFVRLYLRRHTLAQVLAGLVLGAVSVWAASLFGCFV